MYVYIYNYIYLIIYIICIINYITAALMGLAGPVRSLEKIQIDGNYHPPKSLT